VRVGVLGGVFNPPHMGHLVCAQEALLRMRLDTVLFVPVGEAPHRAVEDDPGGEVRAELCDRAVEGDARFRVSRLEVERPGRSYTADTLRALREESRGEDSHVLILGADQAASLPEWHEPEEVLRLAVVAVAEREETRRARVKDAVTRLRGAERVGFFDMPRLDVSSTLVRERARLGQPVRYLVPDAVAEAIEERGLYSESAPVGAD
jgi:nicotinate-nucleotide adenylyltransferase